MLDEFLRKIDFERCAIETTLYKKDGLYLLIYVDDLFYIVLTWNELRSLRKKFQKDLR